MNSSILLIVMVFHLYVKTIEKLNHLNSTTIIKIYFKHFLLKKIFL